MKTPPYFPVYPKDQLTNGKLLSLSPSAFRAYHLLLYQSWTEEVTASLPDDDSLLACYARMPCSEWLVVKSEVLPLFNRRKDSRWYIDWLRTEFERLRNFQKSRQRAAEKRWEGKKNDKKSASCKPRKEETLNARALHNESTSNADAMHVECFSSSSAHADECSFLEERTKEPVEIPPPAVAETKHEKTPKVERKPQERDWLWDWFTEFCALTKSFPGKRLGKAINALWKDNPTLEQCHHFERYWNEIDWRGVEGRLPAPEQVCSEWGKAQRWEPVPDIEPAQPNLPGNALAIVPRNGNGHQPMQLSYQVQNELLRQHKEQQSKAEIAEHVQRMNENQEKYAIKKRW